MIQVLFHSVSLVNIVFAFVFGFYELMSDCFVLFCITDSIISGAPENGQISSNESFGQSYGSNSFEM